MSEPLYDVTIIGAGISGLCAAKVLAENGASVLVLEARNRVGGRTWTVKNSQVGWVDIGGAYVGRSQNHLLRLLKELGLTLYNVNEVQKLVYLNGHTGRRSLYSFDQMPALSFATALDINHITRLMDRMGEEIPVDAPWEAPHAEEWDQMTFKEFLQANLTDGEAIQYMRTFISTCVTNEPYQSSLLWFLWYVKQCGGTKSIFSTTNGGQEFKVHGGTNQITQLLAAQLGPERVHLSSPVHYLEQADNQVTVRTLNGREFKSRYVILAIPPAVQQKIHYEPALPPMRNQLIQRAPMGSVFKCIVYYERAFWIDRNMCGCMIFNGEDGKFPITFTLDDSKPDGTKPAIIGFLPADKARKLTSHTQEERMRIICNAYAIAFGTDEAKKPIHYVEQNWMGEQYSGGCYTMTCGPGFLTRFGPHLRRPIGRMYFAGTEVATAWSGYINGGVQAGERTARAVLVQLGRLKESQIEQVEPVSLEYPPVPFETTTWERYAPSARGFRRGLIATSFAAVLAVATAAFYF